MATLQQAHRDQSGPASRTFAGLQAAEVQARHAAGEHNDVPLTSSRSYGQIVRDNAFLSINVIIFIIGIVLVLMGLYRDALLTAGLVLLNVVISIWQEARAKRALDRITLLTRMRVTAIRDGAEQRIGPEEIVLGDVLVARPGDQVMVDGRILSGSDVEVDESLLTGESEPVTLHAGDAVSSGSFCVSGELVYEATRVGLDSRANRMTIQARSFEAVKTPLQRDIDLVLRVMVIVMMVLGGPIALDLAIRILGTLSTAVGGPFSDALSRAYQGYSARENVQAIAIVAGLVPQGLALMLTVTYAMGAVRLAGQRALLQQASGMESLSHVDVVCFDKTGTLTTNRLTVQGLAPIAAGAHTLARLLGDYAASTTAPNRTIDAIRSAYPGQRRDLRAEMPFSSARKWSGMTFSDAESGTLVLGAPEVLQPFLRDYDGLDGTLQEWLRRGFRVLMLARAEVEGEIGLGPGKNLLPLGLVSFRDELNPDAVHVIEAFRNSGVAIKIISGDHPETVAALAHQAGLDPGRSLHVISGLDLTRMTTEQQARAAEECEIFGRISPQQKVDLVEHLQRNGHYVAMVGDGVNDALAVKRAQVGIAMEYGSQATRAVADLVLLSNVFTALPAALREGRRIVRASHDMMTLFLSRSLAMVSTILAAGIVGAVFPFIPTHNFLPAFLTVGVPTFFIAAWARPGEIPGHRMRSVMAFVLPAALSIGAVEAIVYISYLRITADVVHARTVVITVAVLCGLLLILFAEPPGSWWTGGDSLSGDRRIVWLVGVLIASFAVVLLNERARTFFGLSRLSLTDGAIILASITAWVFGLRAIWRHHLAQRVLGTA